jgi:hypothetical protein
MEDVFEKVLAIRAAKKASLSGIELMQYNLFWKLRDWIMRETGYRCVCIAEVVDKVHRYAPKAILKNREQFKKAVNDLWNCAHEYTIDSENYLREDLEFNLSFLYK